RQGVARRGGTGRGQTPPAPQVGPNGPETGGRKEVDVHGQEDNRKEDDGEVDAGNEEDSSKNNRRKKDGGKEDNTPQAHGLTAHHSVAELKS
ncbi:MAG: hypothetical protein HOY79_34275, partial [Streptomyces sp.]|nr:hypothetical protein [Streptomyces sp.]